MCGIVGIIGNQAAKEALLQGLEKLEYRGYDSAGIFVKDGENDALVKAAGRIACLREKAQATMEGSLGIGHTRWATHGEANEQNAHPHQSFDGRFILVHNGVINNEQALKTRYLSNITLQSDTDSEIAVQVLAKLVADGMSIKEALHQLTREIEGSYAFAIIDRNDPNTLYAAKNKSPLLIGVGDGFNMVGSDAMAMITSTSTFMEIMDGEIVTLTADTVTVENAIGQVVPRETYQATIDANEMDKGTYPFYMLKEIDEQPGVMRAISQAYENGIDNSIINDMKQADRLYIIACGTSMHAGLVGAKILECMTNIPTEVHIASEFAYDMPRLSQKPYFIFISQSGETADSRQVLVNIKQLGHPSLTLTNVEGSTLSREADHTLLLHAGPEIAVASTKAYTAQIAVLAILAKELGEALNQDTAKTFDVLHELGLVATAMDSLIAEKENIDTFVAQHLQNAEHVFYIGRGLDYALSLEAALKLKEISYIHTEGFAAGELKHGTIALIEEGTPVIALISQENTAAHTRSNLKETMSRGADTLTIAMESVATEEDTFVVPTVHELLTPLAMIIPCQFIAYYAALHRDLDVDKPRNLAKSVTVE